MTRTAKTYYSMFMEGTPSRVEISIADLKMLGMTGHTIRCGAFNRTIGAEIARRTFGMTYREIQKFFT